MLNHLPPFYTKMPGNSHSSQLVNGKTGIQAVLFDSNVCSVDAFNISSSVQDSSNYQLLKAGWGFFSRIMRCRIRHLPQSVLYCRNLPQANVWLHWLHGSPPPRPFFCLLNLLYNILYKMVLLPSHYSLMPFNEALSFAGCIFISFISAKLKR